LVHVRTAGPPEKAQLERLHGNRKAYDLEVRPHLMAKAIQALQDAGVEPDVWKIEDLERRADCENVVAADVAGSGVSSPEPADPKKSKPGHVRVRRETRQSTYGTSR